MISKEQFEALKNLNNSKVNEILNILDEGCWYVYPKGSMQYNENNGQGYAVDFRGRWINSVDWLKRTGKVIPRKATKEQVKEALMNEAKKRGLYNIGDLKIKSIGRINYSGLITINNAYCYDIQLDRLYLDGAIIYEKGKWAEVVQNNSEIKKEIAELENKLQELKNKL